MSSSKRASPAKSQSPPAVPPTAKQEKTEAKGTPLVRAERLLNVAVAPAKNSAQWKQLPPMTWAGLLDWLDLPHPADRRECGCYVGGLLRDGIRDREHVVSRSVLVLDADKAGPSFLADVARVLPGVAVAVHSTWRHGAVGARYRLLAPLSQDVSGEQYQRLACAVRDALGEHWGGDKGCPEPERFMFRASSQNSSYASHVLPGEPLDVQAWLRDEPQQDEEPPAPGRRTSRCTRTPPAPSRPSLPGWTRASCWAGTASRGTTRRTRSPACWSSSPTARGPATRWTRPRLTCWAVPRPTRARPSGARAVLGQRREEGRHQGPTPPGR